MENTSNNDSSDSLANAITHKKIELVPNLKCIDGIWISDAFRKEDVQSALRYEARSDDVFIVSYNRSGTTWMQIILYSLFNGQPFDLDWSDFESRTPFFEVVGSEGTEQMRRPGTIKTHLPLDRISYHPEAKYVCVLRNPKDVCVSFYRFYIVGFENDPNLPSFNDYFDSFMQGQLDFGDYFDQLQSIWSYKDKPNVIIILYEDMVSDIRSSIHRLSSFLQIPLDSTLLESVIRYSSLSYMQENYNQKRFDFYANLHQCNDASQTLVLQKTALFELQVFPGLISAPVPQKIRDGKVGAGSVYFTREQTHEMDNKLRKTMDGTGFLEYLSQEHAKDWLSSE